MKKRHVLWILLLLAAAVGFLAGPRLAEHGRRLFHPRPYEALVERECAEFSLESSLVYAVMRTESHFQEDAESHAGAKGLMQLTPETFHWIASLYPPENGGEDILDPGDNIHCGCAMLRLLLDRYGGLEPALCAYNAGIGTVDGWLADGDISEDGETLLRIPYEETKNYVNKVTEAQAAYRSLYG